MTHFRSSGQDSAETLYRYRREIHAEIGLAVGTECLKQQPSPAPDLKNPRRRQFTYPRYRVVDPTAHLVGGDWTACVTTGPADEIRRAVIIERSHIRGVIEVAPHRDLSQLNVIGVGRRSTLV